MDESYVYIQLQPKGLCIRLLSVMTRSLCSSDAGLKGGVLIGGFLTPPIAIGAGGALIGIGIIKCPFKK